MGWLRHYDRPTPKRPKLLSMSMGAMGWRVAELLGSDAKKTPGFVPGGVGGVGCLGDAV